MLVTPSRGRAASLLRTLAESQPQTRGVVCLDQDDAASYQTVLILPPHWEVLVGPRTGYVGWLNRAFAAFPDEPWYAYWGDDCVGRPVGWDTRLAAFAGTDRIAYGDDLINGPTTCCLPFIGGDLVRAVGWLACPRMGHLYCDTVWREIGTALDVLTYYPEIITEHQHWTTGKQPYDQTAQERQTTGDREAYAVFLAEDLKGVLARCST